MNECTDYNNDSLKGKRRIVCAAIHNEGTIILGVRHHDNFMNDYIAEIEHGSRFLDKSKNKQGFVDQWGNFINRQDALIVAKAANQIIRTGPGFDGTYQLYSENLY